jgi:hypothetical protein
MVSASDGCGIENTLCGTVISEKGYTTVRMVRVKAIMFVMMRIENFKDIF